MSNPKLQGAGSMNTNDIAVQAVHAAICEDSLEECRLWQGPCVKAVKAAGPHLMAKAFEDGMNEAGWNGNPYEGEEVR